MLISSSAKDRLCLQQPLLSHLNLHLFVVLWEPSHGSINIPSDLGGKYDVKACPEAN